MKSSRPLGLALALYILSLIGSAPASDAAAKDWPEGFEIAERTTSPDGRLGLLIPTQEAGQTLDEDKITNTIVDLKTHRQIAVVRGVKYWHENHTGLVVQWAADSRWCAVTFDARYGFDTITIVDLHGDKPAQFEVGKHIQTALDAIIAQQAHSKDAGGYATAWFRSGTGREVLVRATAATNPKQLEGTPTYCAYFSGTLDLAAGGKWLHSEARKVTSEDQDGLESAFGELSEDGISFPDEKDRLKYYDDFLNAVYHGVRLALPPERFAAVKKEQIAWVKQLEAKPSVDEKCKFIASRVKELQSLLW
jgi:hypothetical protein